MALLLQRFLLWQVLRDSHRLEVDLGSPEIARLVMNILNHKSGGHVLFQFSVWHESCRLISPRLNPKLPPRLTPPAIPAAGLSYPSWQAIYRTSLCAPSAYACANLYDYDWLCVCVCVRVYLLLQFLYAYSTVYRRCTAYPKSVTRTRISPNQMRSTWMDVVSSNINFNHLS